MPNYKYRAISATGEIKAGSLSAVSASTLRRDLHVQGFCVLQVDRAWWDFGGAERRVSMAELHATSRELAALLRAGVSLPESLRLLSDTTGGFASQALAGARRALMEGAAPSAAFAAQEPAFPPEFLQMMQLGETSGDLAGAMERYAAHSRRQRLMRAKLRHASYYPAILLGVILLALSVLLLFAVPRFARMYEDLGAAMPPATQFLLLLSRNFPWLLLALILIGWGTWGLRDRMGPLWTAAARAPVVRHLMTAYERAAFMRNFATLLASGMTAVRAMESAAEALPPRFAERLWRIARQIAWGTPLSRAMADSGVLPPTGMRVIEVAERTGNLPAQAALLADFYEEALDDALARAVAVIEPVMILVMGVVVGAIVLSMYLPIFSLAAAVR